MDSKGGRIEITINGRVYSGRGEATIKPARATRTNGANMDGTGFSYVEPKLASASLSFDRGIDLKWDESMMLQSLDVTFVETDAGNRQHFFSRARWAGEPEINTSTGEVTGLTIETDSYQVH